MEQKGIRKDNLGIFEDRTKKLSIEEVSSPEYKYRFAFSLNKLPVNKNQKSAYWLRFTLINKTTYDKKFLIELFDHNINFVTFYYPDDHNRYRSLRSGNLLTFSSRTYAHKNFEFDLPISRGQTKTFYLRVESENENVIMPEIRSYKKFIHYVLNEYYILGIFYGILLMMAAYNMILFTSIRKMNYLYYVLYTLCSALYSMCQNGVGFHFLWPDTPLWNRYAFAAALYGTILFSLLFTRSFLDLKKKLPYWNKIILGIIAFRTGMLLTGLFLWKPVLYAFYIDSIILSVAFLAGIIAYRKGDFAARYFVYAYCLLFVGFLVTALENYGFITSNIFTVYGLNIGILLEILFFSISLADRVRAEIQMREEAQEKVLEEMKEKEQLKDKVNKELEEKVTERTLQLSDALKKLEKQAEEITRMNIRLDLANRDLKKDVTEIARTRIMKTYVGFDEFAKVYPDMLSCYRFLEELKNEQGFVCKKCQHTAAGKGKEVFDRRCNRCGYNESITANTVFHKLKFPIVKAFYMIYLVTSRKDITAEDLSEMLSLRKSTCSNFKKKIQDRLHKKDRKEIQSWDVLILDNEFETAGEDDA